MALSELLLHYKNHFPKLNKDLKTIVDFVLVSVVKLNNIRDVFFEIEMYNRKIYWNDFTGLTTMYN